MSKQAFRWFCVAALVTGGFIAEAPSADAGWLFRRSRRATPVRRATPQPQYQYRAVRSSSSTQPHYRRSSADKQWPGTIGAMSPRYEFFQNVNGYWK